MATEKSGYVYTTIYSDMHGVDLTPNGTGKGECFAYLENMWRDREGGGEGIETIPGFRRVASLNGAIHAIHPHPTEADTLLLHAGHGLYRYPIAWRDTEATPEAIPTAGDGLAEGESHAARDGGILYLTDGVTYSRLTQDGLGPVDADPYRPTVYADKAAYEQQNLLTPLAYEDFTLSDPAAYAYHTEEGFTYKLLPDGRCFIERYTGSDGLMVLPVEATVGGRRYPVCGVACAAFAGNRTVNLLIVPREITELEPSAFAEMYSLDTVVLAGGVAALPDGCFSDCTHLSTLYIGIGLRSLVASALRNTAITDVHFAGDSEALREIDGYDILRDQGDGSPMHYLSAYPATHCLFPFCSEVLEITGITLGGEMPDSNVITFAELRVSTASGERVRAVRMNVEDVTAIYGKTLSIGVRTADCLHESLGGAHPAYTGDGRAAINGCRLIARFDGRLFLSGNPDLPGTVFYTGRRADGTADPTYIGLYQHFTDGDGKSGVRALLSTASHLLVLTEDTLSGPTAFRHEGRDSESDLVPRIYPVTDALADVGAAGGAILFFDDPLFLSHRGLEAVEAVTMTLSEERRLAHRSARVDPMLCREALDDCRLFRFGTYLGIATRAGRVYLADGYERARGNRNAGYDWYCLSDIGSYRNQRTRYHYVTHEIPAPLVGQMIYPRDGSAPLPIVLSDTPGYVDTTTPVVSSTVNDYYLTFQKKNGKAILVDTDGERTGGDFSPATAFLACGGLLFFGTGDGELFVFNTDKREADGSIPRRWYSFAGRAYRSACATREEDGGLPHLKKQTLRGEGAVCLQAMTGSRVAVLIETDGGAPKRVDTLYSGRLDFCETDFATAEYGTGRKLSVPLWEPAGRFVTKAIHLVSEEYMRPFGVISIAYRYRVAGRI